MRCCSCFVVVILTCFVLTETRAQIKPTVRLGGQEQSHVDKAKRIAKAAKRTKKKTKRQRKSEADSLATTKAEQEGERLQDIATQAAKDTLNERIDQQFEDIETYSNEVDAAERLGGQLKGVKEDSLTLKQLADTVATTAVTYAEKELEQEAARRIAEQGEAPDLGSGLPSDMPDPSQLLGAGMTKEEMEKLKALMDLRQAARKAAKSKDLLEMLPTIASSVNTAMPSVNKVKQKYFKYGKIKGHPEKNIFKQQAFHKRFIWGGNLDL